MGFQNVIIQGNLGKDVEQRYTPAGKAVCNFPVAVDEGFGDKKSTTWFNVTAWEKTAEACAKFLSKGSKVLVSGRIQTREYEDRDGVKKYGWDLVAHRVEFLDSKPDGQREQRPAQQSQSGGGFEEAPFNPDDDGIPF